MDTEHRAPSTEHRAPSTEHRAPSTEHRAPSTEHRAPSTELDTLGFSPDASAQRREALLALLRQTAPEVISDNQIDLERLKDLLGPERIAPAAEHYELNWAGKTAARREIQKTTSHTLLPSAANPAQAQHMLIEGENLEVLRVLQKSYYGKVKMIYIDPPYNTGNDSFVYPDDYSETLDEYQRRTGEKSEAGFLNKQSLWKKNSKESGQYHSAWLSMMYPRLYLARNLLENNGFLFISIDDNESANLRLILDEIFGPECFIGDICWESKTKSQNTKTAYNKLQPKIEHIWVYTKGGSKRFNLKIIGERRYNLEDKNGVYRLHELEIMNADGMRGRHSMIFEVQGVWPPNGKQWQIGEDTVNLFKARNDLILIDGWPTLKMRPGDERGDMTEPFWGFISKEIGTAESAKKEFKEIMGGSHYGFETIKPVEVIKQLIFHATKSNDIIIDFFAGSGTTAQAVMELNLEDGGNRQCICVQMPEVLEENSEAYKAGYRTIADITRARIDKVIAKLKAEHPDKTQDLACAHFTLAPSNFKVWRSNVADADALREQLALFQQAEKLVDGGEALDSRLRGNDGERGGNDGDTQTAMLAELLLKHGLGALGVHAIAKPKTIAGATVHRVLLENDRQLWLCFAPYTEALKAAITQARPAQVVLLNSCFVGDKADEQLSNLQLELQGLDIGLLVI